MTETVSGEIGTPLDDWPMFGLIDDIRPALRAALDRNRPVALATLFAAEGGSPRGQGAQMLVTGEGAVGYLSGGCIEADIAIHGRKTILDGQPHHLVYGRGGPIDIRLPCGGRIDVLVERILPDDPAAARLLTLEECRTPALWLTDGRNRACVSEGEAVPAGQFLFGRRFLPRRRTVILGGDPIALALSMMASQSGAEVFINRPKGPELHPPVAAVYSRWTPAEALATISLDIWTAIVIAHHDDIHDHDALVHALPSEARYVGLLGSSRRLPLKLQKLRASGLTEEQIGRLKAPIGLSLGGRAPWEIATAIQAEIIQTAYSSPPDFIAPGTVPTFVAEPRA